MDTLQIQLSNARAVYDGADESGKAILRDLLGADHFKPVDIRDRVKTYEDACRELGLAHSEIGVVYSALPLEDEKAAEAFLQLTIIARALNEGWKPDWNNPKEYKYYPWFKANPAGSGFSFYGFGFGFSVSGVGSRLCFKSRELADYAGKQFEDLYNTMFSL